MSGADDVRDVRVPGAILAGGQSRRFGSSKALAELGGRPLIRIAAETLSAVASPLLVVTDDARVVEASGVESRPDLRPDRGPLGGLETALSWARELGAPGVLSTGCDTPLLSPEALRAVLGDGRRSAVARGRDGLHPLCGFYRVELLDEVGDRLDRGELSLHALVEGTPVTTVALAEHLGSDRAERELTNVNTPAALAALEGGTRE